MFTTLLIVASVFWLLVVRAAQYVTVQGTNDQLIPYDASLESQYSNPNNIVGIGGSYQFATLRFQGIALSIGFSQLLPGTTVVFALDDTPGYGITYEGYDSQFLYGIAGLNDGEHTISLYIPSSAVQDGTFSFTYACDTNCTPLEGPAAQYPYASCDSQSNGYSYGCSPTYVAPSDQSPYAPTTTTTTDSIGSQTQTPGFTPNQTSISPAGSTSSLGASTMPSPAWNPSTNPTSNPSPVWNPSNGGRSGSSGLGVHSSLSRGGKIAIGVVFGLFGLLGLLLLAFCYRRRRRESRTYDNGHAAGAVSSDSDVSHHLYDSFPTPPANTVGTGGEREMAYAAGTVPAATRRLSPSLASNELRDTDPFADSETDGTYRASRVSQTTSVPKLLYVPPSSPPLPNAGPGSSSAPPLTAAYPREHDVRASEEDDYLSSSVGSGIAL